MLNSVFNRKILTLLLLGGFFVSASVVVAGNESKPLRMVEPGRTLFGKSYNRLANRWANWLQLEPPETNPAFDIDGRYGGRNQSGKFWFLAGTFEGVTTRRCTVPAGKAIFFPMLAFVSFPPEFPEEGNVCLPLGEGIAGVSCDVNDDIPVAPDVALVVTLDGQHVKDLFAYRVQSPPGGFKLRIVEGGLFNTALGLDAGLRFPAVVDGYWLLLTPPSPGRHRISFGQDLDQDGVIDRGAHYDLVIARRR